MNNCVYYYKYDPPQWPPGVCRNTQRIKSFKDSIVLACPCKYFVDKRQITFEDMDIMPAENFNAEKYIQE